MRTKTISRIFTALQKCCNFGRFLTQKFFKLDSVKRIYIQSNIKCLIPTDFIKAKIGKQRKKPSQGAKDELPIQIMEDRVAQQINILTSRKQKC